MLNDRSKNYLKAVRFERPDYIPMTFVINGSCWNYYPQNELFELLESHPFLFPGYKRPENGIYKPEYHPVARKNHPFKDDFGCVWTTTEDGITGTVTVHPLADMSRIDSYIPPDPSVCTGLGGIDWQKTADSFKAAKKRGELTLGGLRHGHTFLQLCDLCGYENLLVSMADEHPNLMKIIDMVEEFNYQIVERYLSMGVDQMGYAEDLGMQLGPMISPALFKRYIKPSYRRLMKPALDKDIIVHMHSDGDIRDLADDLIDSGVQVINLQDLVNGIDWIANRYKNKVCVDLDIDRQTITTFGSPKQIDGLIREEVEKLGSPQGGLMMIFGLYPGAPLENIKALMDALEKYAFYYS